MTTAYDFAATSITGETVKLGELRGKVILIVNTASKCGFTPQFEGLEKLWQARKDQGLVILGFPCNQFGSQDPGSDGENASFCQLNYGVSFPMMSKVDVNRAAMAGCWAATPPPTSPRRLTPTSPRRWLADRCW